MSYIKQNIIDLLEKDSTNLVAAITEGLETYFEYYSLIELDNLKDILGNFEKNSFFAIRGAIGSGKTSFKTLIKNSLSNEAKLYEFNCSEVTDLDDIFFTFYKFMQKYPLKKDIFRKDNINYKPKSMDEQIISYIKQANNNLVLVFDNFEKLLNDEGELRTANLKSFFELISTNTNIKVLIFSLVNLQCAIDLDNINVCTIRLTGLEENQLKDFFAIFKIDAPQALHQEIYEKTNGYLYSLRFLANTTKILNTTISALLQEANMQPIDFNLFLAKKLLQKLSNDTKKALLYFTVFRHAINENILKTIDYFNNAAVDIETLKTFMLIEGEKNYELKTIFKEYIYESLSLADKMNLHEKVANFYAEQIPMKPAERVIEISRTSMYSEKFYHFNIYSKLEKTQDLKTFKNIESPKMQNSKLDSDTIKYIASTKYIPDYIELSKLAEDDDEKSNDTPEENIDDNQEKEKEHTNQFDDLELSDEEKALLEEYKNDDNNTEDNNSEEHSKRFPEEDNFVNSEFYNATNEDEYPFDESMNSYSYTDNYYGESSDYDFAENPEDIIQATENGDIKKAEDVLKKGIAQYQDGNLIEGISYLKNAVSLLQNKDNNSFYLAKLSLARALSENYKLDEAQSHINDLLAQELPLGIRVDAMLEMATIEENKANYDTAENIYSNIIEFSKNSNLNTPLVKTYFKLALLYDDKNDTEKALSYYTLAINNSTDDTDKYMLASSYSNIASIYEEMNDFDNAIVNYNKSLQLDESAENFEGQVKTLSALGNIYFNRNEKNIAINTFIKEIQVAKKTEDNFYIASSYLELGDTFFKLKDYKNAIKAYFLSKKHIDNTISTDSKNKIERRFDMIVAQIGENAYKFLLQELKK